MANVAIVDSGSGNLRSVERALIAAKASPIVTSDPAVIAAADRLVVPGQGAFGDVIGHFRSRGLDDAVATFVKTGRPYLGICMGLQVLFDCSEESKDCSGLGLIPGRVARFDAKVGKVPHIGWNSVDEVRSDPLLRGIPCGTYFYFIHSYFAVPDDKSVVALQSEYGAPFVAAVRKDNLFACQFHPEKSQGAGLKLLANFVEGT